MQKRPIKPAFSKMPLYGHRQNYTTLKAITRVGLLVGMNNGRLIFEAPNNQKGAPATSYHCVLCERFFTTM
jgi:hypothetical protein